MSGAVVTSATRQQKRGAARREALVLAAADLFWRNGFAATSIADVAENAEVPLGNVYYYFKTKADLAEAVARLFVQQTEALIAEVNDEATEPRQALKLIIQRLKATQAERVKHGCPIANACRSFAVPAPEAAKTAAESFTVLAGYVAKQLVATGQRPSVALSRARSVLCDWQGGIALAHALGEAQVLSEAFLRMERTVSQSN
ncbi:MAG: TetR/AcrR family transcriptional regulator [Pseudomonadota bacterium]